VWDGSVSGICEFTSVKRVPCCVKASMFGVEIGAVSVCAEMIGAQSVDGDYDDWGLSCCGGAAQEDPTSLAVVALAVFAAGVFAARRNPSPAAKTASATKIQRFAQHTS